MSAADSNIVGREAELTRLGEFLRSSTATSSALVIEGEAGVGKTTLWTEAVRSEALGGQVVACTPSEAESRLSFQGLSDLLGPVIGELLETLPPVQRRALQVALLLEAAGDEPADQRTVAAATLAVLREMSGAGPVLVAIDDAQWLDAPSEGSRSRSVVWAHSPCQRWSPCGPRGDRCSSPRWSIGTGSWTACVSGR